MAIDTTPALPGFSNFIIDALDRPGNVDLSKEDYTAEKLLRDYPKVYQAILRALFYYRLPTRTIRDLFHVNGKIVAAIREHVIAASATDGRAAFFINCRAASQRDIIITRLIDAIETKLADDPEQHSVTTLIEWLKAIESDKPASNGVDRKPLKSGETYDLNDYEAVINGLVPEKNSGRQDLGENRDKSTACGSGTVGEQGGDCSTRS